MVTLSKITAQQIAQVASLLLVVVATCIYLYTGAKATLEGFSVTDTEADIQAVRELLKLAQSYPTGPFPQNDLDSGIKNALMHHYLKDDLDCWHAIQVSVANNGNNYAISGSDTLRPYGRDVDNTFVEVKFQDGSNIGIPFYQQAMVGCSLE